MAILVLLIGLLLTGCSPSSTADGTPIVSVGTLYSAYVDNAYKYNDLYAPGTVIMLKGDVVGPSDRDLLPWGSGIGHEDVVLVRPGARPSTVAPEEYGTITSAVAYVPQVPSRVKYDLSANKTTQLLCTLGETKVVDYFLVRMLVVQCNYRINGNVEGG